MGGISGPPMSLNRSRPEPGHDAVDSPAAVLVDQLVGRVDGAAICAPDPDTQVDASARPDRALLDRCRARARDLRVPAAHHPLEALTIEDRTNLLGRVTVRRVEVVATEGLELSHDGR